MAAGWEVDGGVEAVVGAVGGVEGADVGPGLVSVATMTGADGVPISSSPIQVLGEPSPRRFNVTPGVVLQGGLKSPTVRPVGAWSLSKEKV